MPTIVVFLLYIMGAVFLVAFMLGASHVLGERHEARFRNEPFESGDAAYRRFQGALFSSFLYDCHVFCHLRP